MDVGELNQAASAAEPSRVRHFESPICEPISLACEISAYAVDEDEELPLF